ncbi:MAG: hypothetical protein ABWZ16_05105 [Microbacterium sp.]
MQTHAHAGNLYAVRALCHTEPGHGRVLDGAFEIFCDEGDDEVAVGTQLTCTYADDNGDTPARIEITAVEGSDYELSVSVP